MSDPTTTDAPLKAEVRDGKLCIEVGVAVIAYAFNHHEDNNPWSDTREEFVQAWRATDAQEFSGDVLRAMLNEREDGSTPLSDFLDAMSKEAADQGSLGIEESGAPSEVQ